MVKLSARMKRYSVKLGIISSLLFPNIALADNIAHCVTSLNRTFSTYNITTTSNMYLDSISDRFCRADSSTDAGNQGISVNVPGYGELGFNDNQQTTNTQKFCSSYKRTTSSTAATYNYSQTAIESAYRAYETCLKLANGFAQISSEVVSNRLFSITIRPMASASFSIGPIRALNLNCVYNKSAGSADVVTDGLLIKATSTKPIAITCNRTGETTSDNGGTRSIVWPASDIIVPMAGLNETYSVSLPAETLFPSASLNQIYQRIDGSIAQQNTNIDSRINSQNALIDAQLSNITSVLNGKANAIEETVNARLSSFEARLPFSDYQFLGKPPTGKDRFGGPSGGCPDFYTYHSFTSQHSIPGSDLGRNPPTKRLHLCTKEGQ